MGHQHELEIEAALINHMQLTYKGEVSTGDDECPTLTVDTDGEIGNRVVYRSTVRCAQSGALESLHPFLQTPFTVPIVLK